MDPVDLATIISYETGGTFDPMQPGPTTKWGQHRGLIQFGEPQAQQYGADFSNPDAALQSQFGPDGAIVNYYRASGWQPGMGLLDAYSIVNAGGPGRYNASDTAAGGAPGTVRDKVEDQMSGHRQKALALLGQESGGVSPITTSASPSPSPMPAFGSLSPQPIPTDVARYASSPEPKPLSDRLSAAGRALDADSPPPPRLGPMGDARSTGNALLSFMNQPTASEMLLKKRLAGIA